MGVKIYYDGDCVFCAQYSRLVALRKAAGEVELLSLRDHPEAVEEFTKRGLNPNNGFGVLYDGEFHYGDKAFALLNAIEHQQSFYATAMHTLTRNKRVAFLLYRVLTVGRYLLLIVQGLPLIDVKRAAVKAETTSNAKTLTSRSLQLTPLFLLCCFVIQFFLREEERFRAIAGIAAMMVVYGLLFFNIPSVSRRVTFVRHGSWQALIAFIGIAFLFGNMTGHVSLSRLFVFCTFFPIFGIAADYILSSTAEERKARRPVWIFLALAVFVSFPGLYLAPFYGGISGWTYQVDKAKPIRVSNYELVNTDGDVILYNHAFLEPTTQIGRFHFAFLKSPGQTYESYLTFLFDVYKRRYPLIRDGKLHYQRFLGLLAYPTHNITSNNGHIYTKAFAPERIAEIRYVQFEIGWDGTAMNRRIVATKALQARVDPS